MHWNEGPVPVSMLTGGAPATNLVYTHASASKSQSCDCLNSAHHTVPVAMHMRILIKQKHYEQT